MISDLFLFGLFYSSIDYVPFTVALKFQVVILLIESTPWLNDELVIKGSIIENQLSEEGFGVLTKKRVTHANQQRTDRDLACFTELKTCPKHLLSKQARTLNCRNNLHPT